MTQGIYASPAETGEHSPFTSPPQALIRKELARSGILAVRLIGPPGSGKTELIEATLKRLPAPRRVVVIVVNPAAEREAARLRALCGHVASIGAAIPRASHIWHAVQNLSLKDTDLILIETCGGLATLEDLGQDATVATFAITGGDDKAAEYHELLKNSSIVLLTQCDLRPMVKFDEDSFRDDVISINSIAKIVELSSVSGLGMHRWIEWLEAERSAKKRRNSPVNPEQSSTETYYG
jgi:hydrogenase nickel incorporation protein HypB